MTSTSSTTTRTYVSESEIDEDYSDQDDYDEDEDYNEDDYRYGHKRVNFIFCFSKQYSSHFALYLVDFINSLALV